MSKIFTSLFSDRNKLQSAEKESFIRFDAKIEGEFDKSVVSTVISCIVGFSIAGGGIYYGISGMFSPSNDEPVNTAIPEKILE